MKDFRFAEIAPETIAYIVAMGIDPHIITGKEAATIREMLDLDIRTNEDLTAVRNTLVRTYADASSKARAVNDWDTFDRLQTAMSASTAVVDDVLWKRGALR